MTVEYEVVLCWRLMFTAFWLITLVSRSKPCRRLRPDRSCL